MSLNKRKYLFKSLYIMMHSKNIVNASHHKQHSKEKNYYAEIDYSLPHNIDANRIRWPV